MIFASGVIIRPLAPSTTPVMDVHFGANGMNFNSSFFDYDGIQEKLYDVTDVVPTSIHFAL